MKSLIIATVAAFGLALAINTASAMSGESNAEQGSAVGSDRSGSGVTRGGGSGERLLDTGAVAKSGRTYYAVEKTVVNDHSGNVVRQ